MGRSNKEAREEEAVGTSDTVRRGLGSLRTRRQQLEDIIDGADSGTRKKKKSDSDVEDEQPVNKGYRG